VKAAVVHDFTKKLVIEDVPRPEPGPGEVVFKTEASGLCHTDIHAAHGDWPVKPGLPFIPGHVGVGIVESVGAGVKNIKEGDRVALPWLAYACGECEYCVSGWETLCEQGQYAGYLLDGGYAEYVKAYAKYVGRIPERLNPFDAAPLTCAGVTTYKAVKVSGARSSDLVAIYGVGGLGHMALQYAKVAGAAVVAVDLLDEKLQMARELGADYTINARNHDPVEEIKKLGGADAAIVLAVSSKAFEQAYASLRRGGRVVFVGLPAENYIKVPIFETVLNGINIIGSVVGTRVDLQEAYELHAMGKTRVLYETRKIDQVNEAFEEVEQARNPSPRLVFDFT
jgi:propanol-preferring alcohol dehydrogenase